MAPHISEPIDNHGNGRLSPLAKPQVTDIRREKHDLSLEDEIVKGLTGSNQDGEKSMPTLLLYSAEGLKLFEEITYLEEYYLTNTEIGILEKHAEDMAERVKDGSIVVELGSGNLRKVNIFLNALDRQGKKIDYYALDLDLSELNRTLDMVPTESLKNVRYNGLHGTYDDGHAWLKNTPDIKDKPRCILWLGSSAGNFERSAAAQFLKDFVKDALRAGESDYMLVGMDGCKDAKRVYDAYNDPHGITEQFIMSGLKCANKVLGDNYFNIDDWEYRGEWNAERARHQAYYIPKKDISFEGKLAGINLKKGERINIEYSYKFDDHDSRLLWEEAGLTDQAQWANDKGDYHLYMLQKPSFNFGTTTEVYAPEPVPTLLEWKQLWKAWETVTLGMIPQDQLLSKPIDLRNPCIFYLGHIPTFLDSLLTRATGGSATEPKHYQDIFQRGIDPDVDDPTHCHSHSETPDSWPELSEILEFQTRVHHRLQSFYQNESAAHQPLDVKRAIWLGFEHEAMHLETLLYMLLQSESTLPPPNVVLPDFAAQLTCERGQNPLDGGRWATIPAMTLDIGINDPETSSEFGSHFGWDNERPTRKNVHVPGFSVQTHPITNGEYADYLQKTSNEDIPKSWKFIESPVMNGHSSFKDKISVRTVFGAIPLKLAENWPVMASYDELAGYATFINARIPTADELRAVYRYAEETDAAIEKKISKKISAVNGWELPAASDKDSALTKFSHLVHNGVCESPPQNGSLTSQGFLFAPLSRKNVGFRYWHPTSVRSSGGKVLGRGETGGAWEWTSTVLESHDGFIPEKFYPEYTADFFDGKHNVMLGGSWATHPRIAGRKSFVNWYQRNYRYTWGTARLARDLN